MTEAADIIQAVGPIMERPPSASLRESDEELFAPAPESHDRDQIIALLGPTPVSIDDLIRISGLSPAVLRVVLLELELAGRLERHGGGMVSLA